MLRSVKELKGYTIQAQDGPIGSCQDLLFDERDFQVRYLLVDTGEWLPGRKVLIAPVFCYKPDWSTQTIPVGLTKEQIQDSPELSDHEPISHQYQKQHSLFYARFPVTTPTMSAMAHWPYMMPHVATPPRPKADEEAYEVDGFLRSCREVIDYELHTPDDKVGYLYDWILEDDTWSLPFLVLDTRKWLPGHQALVKTSAANYVSWHDHELRLNMTAEEVEECPSYHPSHPINQQVETRRYDYLGRPCDL
ncbi:MAG: PRC-barrel domain containing protein [Deltaproteobacteria bacterium]|nr:MAG: PRC-barrel domain containing protein [Deltaproteobacteria bacterium]